MLEHLRKPSSFSMTSPGRPRKRQRSVIRDSEERQGKPPQWNNALDTLLDRLISIKTEYSSLRDEKSGKVAAIDENMVAAAAAAKAAARVSQRPPSEDVDIFSLGVRVDQKREQPEVLKVPPLPAMKLLMEPDPPEKLIHEQSIIVRAQAINRKNAELARERLPKQPEAQRNKTFHDYFLDEALWMSSDFREERKWKITMARKVSKMVMQYHSQKAQRATRAKAEAHNKIVKIANGIARDVRKFWRQIAEIADYRRSIIEEAELAKERSSRLHTLLDKTAAFSTELAKSLKDPAEKEDDANGPNFGRQAAFQTQRTSSRLDCFTNGAGSSVDGVADTPSQNWSAEEAEDVADAMDVDSVHVDDESTLIAAEAQEEKDENEIPNLQGQADMNVDDLLRAQGIDPAVYKADQNRYLESDDDQDDDGSDGAVEAPGELDDESTIKAAEETEDRDSEEVSKLQAEAELSIIEILRSQGIDPAKYQADQKQYSRSDSKDSGAADVSEEPKVGKEGKLSGETEMQIAEVSRDASNALPSSKSSKKASGSTLREVPSSLTKDVKKSELSPRGQNSSPSNRDISTSLSAKAANTVSVPSLLLRGQLRDYQRTGMAWLISLYSQKLNGILADEMGLGKTIQAISLLAWLAIEKGIWGPHLIVVPTSVMVNWEVEFKKWLPAFKVLTYFGSMKERKQKRKGWTTPNSFHVCITSYNLAVQDAVILRRKKWVYLVLDEAHNIKNFQSQRWQTLLNFSSERRLLITGTPLQNSVMELWSLMHFLMPSLFQSHSEFKDWFSNPLVDGKASKDDMLKQNGAIVAKLHEVLRPFILRRLKVDVERSLPPKLEHVVKCPLSKRQRQLYEDFMARSDIRDTLHTGDFFSVMNVLMQLRKVCNHPDLFEGRQILSPLSMPAIFYPIPSVVTSISVKAHVKSINLDLLGLDLCTLESTWPGRWFASEAERISAESEMQKELSQLRKSSHSSRDMGNREKASAAYISASTRADSFRRSQLFYFAQRTAMFLRRKALFGEDLRSACLMSPTTLCQSLRCFGSSANIFLSASAKHLVRGLDDVADRATSITNRFVCCISKASAPTVECRFRGDDFMYATMEDMFSKFCRKTARYQILFRAYDVRSKVTIPDTRLIQWDCGKLQVLDRLLRRLRMAGSRVLIFTQMTKVLDILESFLNLHSWRYLRLDGTTKTDDRQKVVERFNQDSRIFCMILTTRAGGVGLNLTGADSVIFYDTDYNPAIDNQAQDRAHRIGQTKPVHIYRLVSEQTVEENILRRANEKRNLESMVISDAGFTTEAITAQDGKARLNGESGKSAHEATRGPIDRTPANSQNSSATKNGFTKLAVPARQGNSQNSTPANAKPSTLSQSLNSAIETAYGPYTGPGNNVGEHGFKGGTSMDGHGGESVCYQDVTSKLLAAEDEREKMAMFAAEQEQRELSAEFNDSSVAGAVQSVSGNDRDTLSYDELESSLTPVQRYALRLVEDGQTKVSNLEDNAEAYAWNVSGRNLVPSEGDIANGAGFALRLAANARDSRTPETADKASLEDEDPLFYEIDISANGQKSYLKALTDTDVDIKLYLPLRDGGPEELKISSVVSGTAAAGLECAEDAAFFPHAYNRMSRTIHSTYRQKEKAKANLRKRRAEKDARRRDMDLATAAALKEKHHAVAGLIQASRLAPVIDRTKTKNKADPFRNLGGPAHKKARLDGSFKTKGSSGHYSAGDGTLTASTGLFKKSTKKNTRRLSLPGGRALIVGSASAMPGEGIGLNEGWTKNEDQKVIASASEWNNNMKLVADALALNVSVPAGIRRQHGEKHCLERLVNSLHKDAKAGPPVPRATETDADIFRKHSDALVVAARTVAKIPPEWMNLPTIPTEWHPSQSKVTTDVATKKTGRFLKRPPTFQSVCRSIQVPPHFRVGFKSTETTPQALNRKRFPFLRQQHDQRGSQRGSRSGNTSRLDRVLPPSIFPRVPAQRSGLLNYRSGAALPRTVGNRQNGLPGLTSSLHGKTVIGQVKGSSSSTAAKQIGRPGVPGRIGVTPKGKGSEGSRAIQVQSGASKGVSVTARKGVFVPGTSARMNICQVGGSIPSLPKASSQSGAQAKVDALRNSGLGKMGLTPVELKSGKIAGQSSRVTIRTVGNGEGLSSNGVLKTTASKPLSLGKVAAGPNRVGSLNTSKSKSSQENRNIVRIGGTKKAEVEAKTSAGTELPRKTGEGDKKGVKKDSV